MAERRASLVAALAAVPMVVWWLGWSPGFASSDTIDQWAQATTGIYTANHPPIHTLYLEAMSLGASYPGLITLFQVLVLAGLLAYATRWLVRWEVPPWLAVGAAWLLGLSPAIAPTTLALWKDVAFGLSFLWVWIELLALSHAKAPVSWARMIRLGLGLAGVWLFRGNGPLTVLLVLPVIVYAMWRTPRRLGVAIATLAATVVLVVGPLYEAIEVQGSGIEPVQVFLPDIAASYNDEPGSFTQADLDLLTAVAPLQVWEERYDCYDSTPLLFDPEFDQGPVRADPAPYRSLLLAVVWRDADNVIEHRLCASNFVYWPPQPDGAYFHRPPYEIPVNEVDLVRQPMSERAFAVTDAVFRWAARDDILWLTWRPAIVVMPALAAVIVFAIVPKARRLLVPSALFVGHVVNVVVTTPAQEFRYAYPLYLVGLLTLTLLWPVVRRSGARSAR